MIRQATILAAAMVTASVTMASAQPYYGYGPRGVMPPPMPSPYGGPVVVVPPPPPMMRPPVVAGVPPYEPGIPSYEVISILRTTGFLPLGAPMRRGRFYVIAAIHPNGDDGRVTIDAVTGRFVRFVPADVVANGAYYDDDGYDDRGPPPGAAPRPPASVPKTAKAGPVTPKPRPQAAPGPVTAQAPPAPEARPVPPAAAAPAPAPKQAEAPAAAPPKPPEAKPSFTPQPTQDMPPVQPIE